MTRKLAHIERITALTPIVGADLIEKATVLSWGVVVKKGTFQVGDLVAFFEIDTLLPHRPWSAFLFKDTRQLYRLRTIRLKGTLSQGLLVSPREMLELPERDWQEGDDERVAFNGDHLDAAVARDGYASGSGTIGEVLALDGDSHFTHSNCGDLNGDETRQVECVRDKDLRRGLLGVEQTQADES